jgi:hypothetical protein
MDHFYRKRTRSYSRCSPGQLGRGFGARSNEAVRKILELPMEDLLPTWEAAARRLLAQKLALDDEINKERELSVCDHFRSSTWYPVLHLRLHFCTRPSKSRGRMTIPHFIQQYVTKLYHAGILHDLLEIDENGKPLKAPR